MALDIITGSVANNVFIALDFVGTANYVIIIPFDKILLPAESVPRTSNDSLIANQHILIAKNFIIAALDSIEISYSLILRAENYCVVSKPFIGSATDCVVKARKNVPNSHNDFQFKFFGWFYGFFFIEFLSLRFYR